MTHPGSGSWVARIGVAAAVMVPTSAWAQFGPTPTFGAATNYPTGIGPQSLVTARFNADMELDLAVVNRDSDSVTILLGDGLGGFTQPAPPGSPIAIGAGTEPWHLAPGDLDEDGDIDLAIANHASHDVSILLGDGLGGFVIGPGSPFAVGTGPTALAIGNVAGDDSLDIVVSNSGTNNISVLTEDGGGTFAIPPVNYPVGTFPEGISLDDLNGDGRLDVIVANFTSGNISVLLANTVTNLLNPAVPYATGAGSACVAVGRLNSDANLDVVVANLNSATMSVLLGNGDGTLEPAQNTAVTAPACVCLADFNLDGKTDVVLSNYFSNTVTLMTGNGTGVVQAVVPALVTGATPVAMAVGDFNGNGKPDLAVPNFGANDASVLLNTTLDADLAVTKTDGQTEATPGGPISYTITVSNAGPGTLSQIALTDALPADLLSPLFAPGTGAYDPLTGAWTGITLIPGGSVSMTLSGTIDPAATGTLVNTVTVATVAPDTDPTPGNNSASDSDTTLVPSADLAITKTGPAAVAPGQNVTYTISVINNGPSEAVDVFVADPTPPGLTFVSSDCGPSFPCGLGGVTAGQTRTITATFAIDPSYLGATLENTATVSTTTADPVSLNNSSTASSIVTTSADLAITKTGPATVSPGQTLTYTITVTNNGPADAATVEVSDATPTGLTFVSNDGDCTIAFPCPLGIVPSGATRTITATYSVPANYAGPNLIPNTASVSSATTELDPSDNSATASTSLGMAFYTIAPCRVLDTRDPANAPALAGGSVRAFAIAGECGVPSTAVAVSINVTVTQPTHQGDLRIYPAGTAPPGASAINYASGQTRANNAVVTLGATGGVAVFCEQPAGTTHVILDVNGYFE